MDIFQGDEPLGFTPSKDQGYWRATFGIDGTLLYANYALLAICP